MKYRLGIDLGGTTAKLAVVTENAKIAKEGLVATSGFPNPAQLATKLAETCKRLVVGKKVAKVGIGVAGDIDSKRGVVRVSPNLGWKNVPLGKLMQQKLKVPVVVENDANAAAWGFYKTQVPSSVKNLIVLTLGTGVGGGIIIDGKLLSGATGSAGEVGHMIIEENGPLCNCGNRGCLETYVGGPHLIKKVKVDLEKGQKSSLQNIAIDEITPRILADAANHGDTYALSIWDEVGHALGMGIGDLIYILNPEMIVFTGGIAQSKDLILKPLQRTLAKRAFKTPIQAVKIKIADNAPHVGVIGASLL